LRSYLIQDIRDFTRKLLLGDTFDTFLLSEAEITTYATFHIDGTFHPSYLSTAEAETLTTEQCGYTLWKRIRPLFFELTRGKNTPLNFRIVFRLAPHNVEQLLRLDGIALQSTEVDGLFLNIRYDGQNLQCISGTSLRVFSMDKSLEHAWDDMLEKFFHQKEIPYTLA
jgi:hypothetical protein